MREVLKPLSRLALAGVLVVIAFSVKVTSAQSLPPFCVCVNTDYCVNINGGDRSWQCIPGGCTPQDAKTGLCVKKTTTTCVPDPNAICPLIFAPVTCNNGVTYSNQCFADADCAKGCKAAVEPQ